MTSDVILKPLGPLVSGQELASELRRRKQRDTYVSVTGVTPDHVEQKVKLRESNGWSVVRKNVKSTRMAKTKPADEWIEDEVWTILAQMGFKEMSGGSDFRIEATGQEPIRSISIFAKDDEAALVVFCANKNVGLLIDTVVSSQPIVTRTISKVYGKHTKLKIKFVIATRNVSWSKKNLSRSEEAQISVISDEELGYYSRLTQHLKQAARYQLLGHLLSGQKVTGLKRQVVATRGKMGGETFYSFLIRPDELLKIAYIGHKASRDIDSLETYQRLLQPSRLKKIAEYINGGGKFPSNIVVNLKPQKKSSLRFELKQKFGDEALGVLHLPSTYGAVWVIDGQHRLYGYAYAREDSAFKDDTSVVAVLAFQSLPAEKEMNMFIDINSKQVKVSSGLLVELYADLHWKSPEMEKAFQAQLSRISTRLNLAATSPLRNRIVATGKKKSQFRCLTQTSIRDGLSVTKLLGTLSSGSIKPGPLSTMDPKDYDGNVRKALTVLVECLNIFASHAKGRWELGDGPGGYLCTNNGIRALFHVFKDLADHISKENNIELCRCSAEETTNAITPYINVLAEFFRNAQDQEILSIRNVGSSLTAVRQQAWKMEVQIKKHYPSFEPLGLAEFLASLDEEGTEKASKLVLDIQKRLFSYVIGTLKKTYGTSDKNWWVKGVPVKIRSDCSSRWEENDRDGHAENQLYLPHYIDICIQNWGLVKHVVSLGAKNKEDKKGNTRWIKELNEIRKRIFHPEHGLLKSTQVERVREIHSQVEEYFPYSVAKSHGDESATAK